MRAAGLAVAGSRSAAGTWHAMRQQKTGARGNFEEYKHIYLVQDLTFVERMTAQNSDSDGTAAAIPLQGGTPDGSESQTSAAA